MRNNLIRIGKKRIGYGAPCFIVAEIGLAHDGDFGLALKYIETAAKAGVDAVKFQTHIAEAESTSKEPWRIKFSHRDKNRYAYWQRTSFSFIQWRRLKRYSEKCGLVFLSSPFSNAAVDLLQKIGVSAWKIPSGEITNLHLLDGVIKTKKTVLLSTGMSSIGEIDEIVSKIRRTGVPFALFQCTSSYPCPPEKVGLNLISFFKMRYRCPVGLSDHSGSIYPGLAAVVLGASLLEIHMTLDAKATGPDVSASLALTELKNLVQGVRFIEKMMKNPVKKNSLGREMKYMRRIFMKSIVAAENLVAGTILKERHLAFKKPGTGIPAGDMYFVLGKKLKKSLRKDDFFKKEFLKRVHS